MLVTVAVAALVVRGLVLDGSSPALPGAVLLATVTFVVAASARIHRLRAVSMSTARPRLIWTVTACIAAPGAVAVVGMTMTLV